MAFVKHLFTGSPDEDKHPRDDVLMALGLALICIADGGLDDEEEELLESYRSILPDWRELDRSEAFSNAVDEAIQASMERFNQEHNTTDPDPFEFALFAVDELGEISNARMRERCMLLALDIAMAAGGVTDAEDQVLEKMAKVLTIGAERVHELARVVAIKYAA